MAVRQPAASPLIVARFFNNPKYNHKASLEEKRAIYDDVEQVELRFAGDTQKVSVFPAHEAEPNATRELQDMGMRGEEGSLLDPNDVVTYAMLFPKEYAAFKDGDAQVANGTPLKMMGMSEGKIREMKALNIYTVESLAMLDGPNLRRLGMNGRAFKDSAIEYLATITENTSITPAQHAAAQAEITRLRTQLDELRANGTIRPAPDTPPEVPPNGAKVLSQAEIDQAAEESMDVKSFTDEDLHAYIVNNGGTVAKRASRKSLEAQALAIAER
jgi:hypothetical protein